MTKSSLNGKSIRRRESDQCVEVPTAILAAAVVIGVLLSLINS
jgi:hypothetical protein